MQKKVRKSSKKLSEKGFTVIEVMLVLAITGLLFVGIVGSSFGSIQFQRYEDSVNSFAESLRNIYNEVLNPRSDQGGHSDTAMYGKMIAFAQGGGDKFFTATLVGNSTPPKEDSSFLRSLSDVLIRFQCDTLDQHDLLWGSKVYNTSDEIYDTAVIIARSPISGTVHTVSTSRKYDLSGKNNCEQYGFGRQILADSIGEFAQNGAGSVDKYFMDKDINFCIRSEDNDEIPRVVQIKADGSNTSAVTVLDEAESAALGCQLQMSEGGGPDGP